ncbi:MAG: hypothetical protein JO297_04640 [Nitrososphaeraceae archaeon]|nr:hypothetical protein [Nitrososphaeraceae archaeon]
MQAIEHKTLNMQRLKQESERDCQAIQQQKMKLTDILNTLQQSFDASAEKYLTCTRRNTGCSSRCYI